MGVRKEDDEPLLVSGPQQNEQQEEEEEQERRREGNVGDLVRQTWLESRKMWAIAGPSIFSRLAMFSMTVITQSFAGHLSDLDLAAISIASTVIIAFTFGFLVGDNFPYFPFSMCITYLFFLQH